MNLLTKKALLLFLLIICLPVSAVSIEPKDFIQSTVDKASNILSKKITNEQKIEKLKSIAKESVDVKGI